MSSNLYKQSNSGFLYVKCHDPGQESQDISVLVITFNEGGAPPLCNDKAISFLTRSLPMFAKGDSEEKQSRPDNNRDSGIKRLLRIRELQRIHLTVLTTISKYTCILLTLKNGNTRGKMSISVLSERTSIFKTHHLSNLSITRSWFKQFFYCVFQE